MFRGLETSGDAITSPCPTKATMHTRGEDVLPKLHLCSSRPSQKDVYAIHQKITPPRRRCSSAAWMAFRSGIQPRHAATIRRRNPSRLPDKDLQACRKLIVCCRARLILTFTLKYSGKMRQPEWHGRHPVSHRTPNDLAYPSTCPSIRS
jgi:hypothetical protein